ncbi:uncharacterized protein LOC126452313 [Schistocerca serialis cubense]|uniref:uncharacterized protein LOC126452313 n=1 Tax=Schistocerca serialis cubense TaxID=2023355 RepID=UPI00214E4C1A|nr:uncharacterized protein LOC126452313 [Schistocerca serialis cubense]
MTERVGSDHVAVPEVKRRPYYAPWLEYGKPGRDDDEAAILTFCHILKAAALPSSGQQESGVPPRASPVELQDFAVPVTAASKGVAPLDSTSREVDVPPVAPLAPLTREEPSAARARPSKRPQRPTAVSRQPDEDGFVAPPRRHTSRAAVLQPPQPLPTTSTFTGANVDEMEDGEAPLVPPPPPPPPIVVQWDGVYKDLQQKLERVATSTTIKNGGSVAAARGVPPSPLRNRLPPTVRRGSGKQLALHRSCGPKPSLHGSRHLQSGPRQPPLWRRPPQRPPPPPLLQKQLS